MTDNKYDRAREALLKRDKSLWRDQDEIDEMIVEAGVSGRTFRRARLALEKELNVASGSNKEDQITMDFKSDSGVISVEKSARITSLEQLLDVAGVDMETWEVDRYIVNKWEIGAKDAEAHLQVEPLFQVKVWLKRKLPALPFEVAMKKVAEQLSKAPLHPVQAYEPVSDPHMLEVSLYDHHFGKYAWSAETGQDYDVEIAERIYVQAACDLLEKAKGFPIDLITLVVGQDFLHINNVAGLTEKGTRQDVDTRLAHVVEVGIRAIIRCVEQFRQVAPVKILWVPGNHDPLTSYFLCRELAAYYRHDFGVDVDVSPKSRKRIVYGCNLIAYTHGNEEPHRDLPAIMAGEWPDDWAATSHREWHTGHLHKKKQTNYNAADTYVGVTVRILSSLSATDAWHYKKGYINNLRAAEAFLWSKTRGHTGTFYSTVDAAQASEAEDAA